MDALFNQELLSGSGILTEADIKKNRSSWPITLFMAILVSAPYFIWRIISSLDSQPETNSKTLLMQPLETLIYFLFYNFFPL